MEPRWRRRLLDAVADRQPSTAAAGVLAVGGLLVAVGIGGTDRLATVGVLYVVLGGGLFVATRRTPGYVTGRRTAGFVSVGLAASFAYLSGDLLLARLAYGDLTGGLLFEVAVLSIRRWLPMLAVGGLFLLGAATRPREREGAAAAVVGPLVVVFWLELLGSYAAVFWPVVPLALYVALLVGVALAGGPLYLLGYAVRGRRRE